MGWSIVLFLLHSIFSQIPTPGSIELELFTEKIKKYEHLITQLEKTPSPYHLHVGHRMADYQHYPIQLPTINPQKEYHSIMQMMSEGFSEKEIDGMELDVQLLIHSQLEESLFIVHNRLDSTVFYDQKNLNYLKENSLSHTLQYFIDHIDQFSSKKLYIELKKQEKGADDLYINMIAQTFHSYSLTNHPQYQEFIKSVSFVSFEFSLLQKLQWKLSAKSGSTFHYYLIGTTNFSYFRPLAKIFKLPMIDSELEREMIKAHWLTGVWIDPLWISELTETLHRWNQQRPIPFEYGLGTYTQNFNDWSRTLLEASKGTLFPSINNLIHDIIQKHQQAELFSDQLVRQAGF